MCPLRSEMFNVNYFVVSQCNPYVLPLISELGLLHGSSAGVCVAAMLLSCARVEQRECGCRLDGMSRGKCRGCGGRSPAVPPVVETALRPSAQLPHQGSCHMGREHASLTL